MLKQSEQTLAAMLYRAYPLPWLFENLDDKDPESGILN
jgi:hypothetical protein